MLRYSVQGDFAKQNVPRTLGLASIEMKKNFSQFVWRESGEFSSGFILSRSSNPCARAIIQMISFIDFYRHKKNKILIVGLHTGDAPRVAGVAQNVALLLCFCCCC